MEHDRNQTISFQARFAERVVEIHCPSPELRDFCAEYLVDASCAPDLSVTVTEQDIAAEAAHYPVADSTPLLYEITAVQRKIAEALPLYDCFVMHGAAITYQNDAYFFCAPSGVGKSTHISLWKRYLGAKVDIINGDKPFLSPDPRARGFRIHGSPWAGKEGWQKNRSAPLRGICFLSQAAENSITRLQPAQCLPQLMRQVYIPHDTAAAGKTLQLVDRLVSDIPLYQLRCNISEDAVKCCFEALTGLTYPNQK